MISVQGLIAQFAVLALAVLLALHFLFGVV